MKLKRKLPAYPIFLKDPNFSFWSVTESLNAANLQTWYGEEKKIYGFVKTDGKIYCFMGDAAKWYGCVKNAEQTYINVTAFSTEYGFKAGSAKIKVRFVSPLPPNDLTLLSMPVCYMEYEIEGGKDVSVYLFAGRELACNRTHPDKRLRSMAVVSDGFEYAVLGLKKQLPLSNNDDAIGADWGYWYVAGERAYALDGDDLRNFVSCGKTQFSNTGEDRYIGASVSKPQGRISLGYDDIVSIDYFGDFLKGYYLKRYKITDAIKYVWDNGDKINTELSEFENGLKARAEKYGTEYLDILYASLRQSVAGHKLVEDNAGNVLFLSKECYSNGCMATVDVSYPSMPLYLVYNAELVKGMLRPIFAFAKMPVWNCDFAPHDVGTYPACCGQIYGLKNLGSLTDRIYGDGDTRFPFYLLPASADIYDFEFQMPVEECANMIIMLLACFRADGDLSLYKENSGLTAKWVEYLVKYGLKPENQLCTDDFAGHLADNINLAIKATVGIAAYAELCLAAGKQAEYKKYREIAESYAAEIIEFGNGFTHLPLTWNSGEQTFSLKYNLAFDKILKLGLFPQSFLERETDFYLKKIEKFGVPLDSREDYSKSDWLMWVASLTDDENKRSVFIKCINDFLEQSPGRVAFSDWFDVKSGEFFQFRARTVQGGNFILLLNKGL